MFATPNMTAACLYRLTGQLRLGESSDGRFRLLPGCFADVHDPVALWINHDYRIGALARLTERDGTLHLSCELDPTCRRDDWLIDQILAGESSGFSFAGKSTMHANGRDVVAYRPREVSIVLRPTEPRFQSEVRIERI